VKPLIDVLLAAMLSVDPSTAATEPEPVLGPPSMVGMMRSAAIAEVSGVAASRRHDNVLWAVNDSDHPASLEALDHDGEHLHGVDILGATNIDWEDVATFVRNGKPMVLIADSGDNGGLRPHLSFYLVAEPDLDARTATIIRRYDVKFADGPHDVEAVFVDAAADRVYLIAKRQIPPVLYSFGLTARRGVVTARVDGDFATIPRASADDLAAMPRFAKYFGQATSAVADPDGRFVAVLTYRDAYLFPRESGQSWLDALRSEPVRFGLPFMPQAEAITFVPSSLEFLITTENLPAPILSVRLPGTQTPAE